MCNFRDLPLGIVCARGNLRLADYQHSGPADIRKRRVSWNLLRPLLHAWSRQRVVGLAWGSLLVKVCSLCPLIGLTQHQIA